MKPSAAAIAAQVGLALQEDIGSGDLTARLVPAEESAQAGIIAREEAVLCGLDWVNEVFRQVDPGVCVEWTVADAERLAPGQCICTLTGPARSLLTGERTALNFLQTLSGTATRAARYVALLAGTGARILDTRKTIPGLRLAQKYAVTCGGASNHRIGLFDAILIKENHIAAAGSVTAALQVAARVADVEIEIEVEDMDQLREALAAGARRVLLDNFSLEQLREAVALNGGRAQAGGLGRGESVHGKGDCRNRCGRHLGR